MPARWFMSQGLIENIIGQTPLIYLKKLSQKTGNHIWGKAEFLNPGGSIKDRAALGIILDAEKKGQLKPGMIIVEGTAGNTGIGLATLAPQKGYHCHIVMPNNQSEEKYQTLKALGAELTTVDPCPFANPQHFYHTARRIAESDPQKYFWANQFENTANSQFHFDHTGPEIYEQLQGKIDHFCCSTGTGGTIGGITSFLKQKNPHIHTTLLDPMGSGMYDFFRTQQIKSTGSSITEGIGIMRITENFKRAKIDDAMQIDDQKMLSMLYFLAQEEGLLVGTSAALNVYGAYEIAKQIPNQNKHIVTMLCDSALRYQSKVFNDTWLKEKKLWPIQSLF